MVISVDDVTCPPSWKSWPTVRLGEFTNKNVKDLLRAELALFALTISPESENRILTYCRTPQTANPLYVVIMASDLAQCGGGGAGGGGSDEQMQKRVDLLLQPNTVQLYKAIVENGRRDVETCDVDESLIVRALRLIYASRNGVSETELFDVLPELSWNFWAPVADALIARHVIAFRYRSSLDRIQVSLDT